MAHGLPGCNLWVIMISEHVSPFPLPTTLLSAGIEPAPGFLLTSLSTRTETSKDGGYSKSHMCVCVCVCVCVLSHVQLCASLWIVALQAPLSMGFSRQEYKNKLPCPSSGDFPNPGIEPESPTSQADFLPTEPSGKP